MSRPAQSAAVASITCPKCMGSRKFRMYSVETGRCSYQGRCFNCDGTGRVSEASVTRSKAARGRMAHILYTIQHIAIPAALDGNDERAEFYLRKTVPAMFTIGKANAREVLAAVATGRWYDDEAGTRGDAPEIGVRLRARLIEMGRAAKAQEDNAQADSDA